MFDLYELYVTSYNFVPVLHNNQHRAAQLFQKNDILRYRTVDARRDLDRTVQRRPTKAYNAKVENADRISRIPWIRVIIPQIPKIWRHFTFTKDAHLKCARHILAQRQPIAPHMRLWRFFICRWISAHCSLIRKR
jgi:hypothetical protein